MLESLLEVCRDLKLSTLAEQLPRQLEEASRQGITHENWLYQLLLEEQQQRNSKRIQRRLHDAKFPIVKTFDGFDFSRAQQLSETRLRRLAEGDYIQHARPIILMGEPGTGKTHIASALGYEAIQSNVRVRFVTASHLLNQLTEARNQHNLSKIIASYARWKLLIIDELGYLPLAQTDAELLFQVLSERHEQASVIITTNLPFSEWNKVFPDLRLCKALLDRLTHRAEIIETGSQSMRFTETMKHLKESNQEEVKNDAL